MHCLLRRDFVEQEVRKRRVRVEPAVAWHGPVDIGEADGCSLALVIDGHLERTAIAAAGADQTDALAAAVARRQQDQFAAGGGGDDHFARRAVRRCDRHAYRRLAAAPTQRDATVDIGRLGLDVARAADRRVAHVAIFDGQAEFVDQAHSQRERVGRGGLGRGGRLGFDHFALGLGRGGCDFAAGVVGGAGIALFANRLCGRHRFVPCAAREPERDDGRDREQGEEGERVLFGHGNRGRTSGAVEVSQKPTPTW